jgi:hypothetical protein
MMKTLLQALVLVSGAILVSGCSTDIEDGINAELADLGSAEPVEEVEQAAYKSGCVGHPGYAACTWLDADNVCLGTDLATLYVCDNTQDGHYTYARVNGAYYEDDAHGNGCTTAWVDWGSLVSFNVCRDDGSGCGIPCIMK